MYFFLCGWLLLLCGLSEEPFSFFFGASLSSLSSFSAGALSEDFESLEVFLSSELLEADGLEPLLAGLESAGLAFGAGFSLG